MGKNKGLTILLDEDIAATLLIDFLGWKGYRVEVAVKGEKDHLLRKRLAKSPLPLFFTKDKGWLQAGGVPTRHGGVVVFDAGHQEDTALTGLVNNFLNVLERDKRLSGALLDRRFLYAADSIHEYAPDGTITRIWPSVSAKSARPTGRLAAPE